MRRFDGNGAIDIYREYGDRRPSVDKLYGLFERADFDAADDPDVLCIMGDMCIDLAMNHPDDNNDWFKTAEETLDEAYETTTDMYKRGYTVNLAPAVRALLRKSEIPRWQQAAAGISPTPPDYLEVLELAEKVLPLAAELPEDNRKPESDFLEYMPLFLGARATALSLNGWQGRLSLDREDRRPLSKPGFNPNWDTGVMATESAESFVSPEYLLQIKAGENQFSFGEYRRAGVKRIAAVRYGFYDFATIIDQANRELDTITAGRPFSPITQQLNTLTGKLREAIRQPL